MYFASRPRHFVPTSGAASLWRGSPGSGGLNKDQFGDRLVVNLKPRLAQLVHLRVITSAQADIVIDRIQRGNIPWWDGVGR